MNLPKLSRMAAGLLAGHGRGSGDERFDLAGIRDGQIHLTAETGALEEFSR
jgi:hypothetical protein